MRQTVFPVEGKLNLQPAGCTEQQQPAGRQRRNAHEKSDESEFVSENFGNVAWDQRGSPIGADARAPGGG